MSETPDARHKLHWLPNALTVSRILLIPVLVWGIIYPYISYHGADNPLGFIPFLVLILFILCMITDFLDGYFARKWQVTSPFGRMLDPIADKLLVASCLISLCIIADGAPIIVIPSLIIIGRDIFVSGIREHAANSNIILSPTKLAKWKTACEMFAILLSFIAQSLPIESHEIASVLGLCFMAILWLAAILSSYTGFHYFRSAMRKTG